MNIEFLTVLSQNATLSYPPSKKTDDQSAVFANTIKAMVLGHKGIQDLKINVPARLPEPIHDYYYHIKKTREHTLIFVTHRSDTQQPNALQIHNIFNKIEEAAQKKDMTALQKIQRDPLTAATSIEEIIQAEVDEITQTMSDNIEKALQRGERLEDLLYKSDHLNTPAFLFKRASKVTNRGALSVCCSECCQAICCCPCNTARFFRRLIAKACGCFGSCCCNTSSELSINGGYAKAPNAGPMR